MANKFTYFQVNNYNKPMTVDDVFRNVAAYSGIFSADIYKLYSTSYTSSGVSSPTATTWAVTNIHKPSPGNIGIRMGAGIAIEFDFTAAPWGIALLAPHPANIPNTYIVGMDNTFNPKLLKGNTLLYQGHASMSFGARVRVVARLVQFGDSTQTVYAAISMWDNGQLVFSRLDPFTFTFNAQGPSWGVASYGGMGYTLTNLTVTQLGDTVDALTIDPGEKPSSGLQRSIEGYYYRYWMRHGDTLFAKKPALQGSSYFFNDSQLFTRQRSLDVRDLASHVRLVGAYTEAEQIDTTMLGRVGHRFRTVHNPFLVTERECQFEAEDMIRRIQSEAEHMMIEHPAHILLEVEDRVDVDGVGWIIDSITRTITPGSIRQTTNMRRYI